MLHLKSVFKQTAANIQHQK